MSVAAACHVMWQHIGETEAKKQASLDHAVCCGNNGDISLNNFDCKKKGKEKKEDKSKEHRSG